MAVSKKRHTKGFLLIEALLALFMLSMFSIIAFSAYATIQKRKRRALLRCAAFSYAYSLAHSLKNPTAVTHHEPFSYSIERSDFLFHGTSDIYADKYTIHVSWSEKDQEDSIVLGVIVPHAQ